MTKLRFLISCGVIFLFGAPSRGHGQVAAGAAVPRAPATPPPPATKLEAFHTAAGSVIPLRYNQLGPVNYEVLVDAREVSDPRGAKVRGVVVTVLESQYVTERAFIDADELPELLRGIDALLAVKANPTRYENFEVRYTTKGELELSVFSSGSKIQYAIQAGRVTTATARVNEEALQRFRAM